MSRTSPFTVANAVCLLVLTAGCRRLEEDEAGACLHVEKVSGVQLEDGQDETSLQVSLCPDAYAVAFCFFRVILYCSTTVHVRSQVWELLKWAVSQAPSSCSNSATAQPHSHAAAVFLWWYLTIKSLVGFRIWKDVNQMVENASPEMRIHVSAECVHEVLLLAGSHRRRSKRYNVFKRQRYLDLLNSLLIKAAVSVVCIQEKAE